MLPKMANLPSFAPSFGVSERHAVLAGRAVEMGELETAYRAVRDRAQAQIVTLVSPAGLGKTRLVRDFLVKVRAHGGRPPRVYRGTAREDGAAYDVFARVLRARFGITEGMDPEAAKAQVRSQVSTVLEDRKVGDVVYFLGHLLDLAFRDSPIIKAVEADALQLEGVRRAVIRSFLEADAGSHNPRESSGPGPLVLVFDDLHWAHDESITLLSHLVEALTGPILLVCAARPELLARDEAWATRGGEKKHRLIELGPLSPTHSSSLMQDLLSPCGEGDAVDELIEHAVEMAGGNPALLEQMVRVFLEIGVVEREVGSSDDGGQSEEAWQVHVDRLADAELPLTVQDAVDARIAALSQRERELLQAAATMGPVFWVGGLIAVGRLAKAAPRIWRMSEDEDEREIRTLLDGLVQRDFVLRVPHSTFAGDDEFVFKHNLEREAFVRLTPPARAKRYHGAIAEWLAFKPRVREHEEYLGMLARHHETAGLPTHAAAALLEAADVARARYANARAAEYYQRGLAMLDGGAEADPERRIHALHQYGDVLQSLGRTTAALDAFREMLERAYALNQLTKGGAAHGRIGRVYRETGRLEEAGEHLDAALKLFEAASDERGIASTVDDIGKLHWLRGDYAQALSHTKHALQMRRKIGDRRSIALSLNNLGLVHQDSGQFKEALEAFEQALQIRREIGDLVGVTITLNNLGTVAQDQRDDARALALFAEAFEVAKETGDRKRIALVLTNLGETHNRLGDADKAIDYLKQAAELADELGDKMGLAEASRGLGKAYLQLKEYTKAREHTARAVELFGATNSRVQVGIALRSLGEVTAAGSAGGDGLKSARGYLLKAIHIFEEIGNEVELARSCRAYADMLRQTAEHQIDPKVVSEADEYSARADEIFAKLRISAYGMEPDGFFAQS